MLPSRRESGEGRQCHWLLWVEQDHRQFHSQSHSRSNHPSDLVIVPVVAVGLVLVVVVFDNVAVVVEAAPVLPGPLRSAVVVVLVFAVEDDGTIVRKIQCLDGAS